MKKLRFMLILLGAIGAGGFAVQFFPLENAKAETIYIQESFSGGKLQNQWVAKGNTCITARNWSGGDVPRCADDGGLDPANGGVLRLTSNANGQVGSIILDQTFDSSQGVEAVFDMYQYNGVPDRNISQPRTADGMSFFILDGESNRGVPDRTGPPGAGLGYASIKDDPTGGCNGGCRGIDHGFVGIGFDAYGNYSSRFVGTNGPGEWTSPEYANRIVVRGSAPRPDQDPYSGYLWGSSERADRPLSSNEKARTPKALRTVKVRIDLQRRMDIDIDYDGSDGQDQWVREVDQLDLNSINKLNRFPGLFRIGFAASTGNGTNIHAIANLKITPFKPEVRAQAETWRGGVKLSNPSVQPEDQGVVGKVFIDNTGTSDTPVTARVTQWYEKNGNFDDTNNAAAAVPLSYRPASVNNPDPATGDRIIYQDPPGGRDYSLKAKTRMQIGGDLPIQTQYQFAKVCTSIEILKVNDEERYANDRLITVVKRSDSCVYVGKRPNVQIWGGDVRAGAAFFGYPSRNDASIYISSFETSDGVYGGWGEYGMLASGAVQSATGGSLSGQSGHAGLSDKDRNLLTFANTNPYGRWGEAGAMSGIVEDLWKRPGVPGAGTIDVGSTSGVLDVNDARVGGDIKGGGKTVIIRAKGKVTIDKDIKLDGNSIGSVGDISQVIIVARNIEIRDGVKQVDAWLIAQPEGENGGIISTCNEAGPTNKYYAGLYIGGPCDANELRVNGLVMARQLQLRRTKGASEASGGFSAHAEVINMRPDSYLWVVQQSTAVGRIDTLFTTELPPRF